MERMCREFVPRQARSHGVSNIKIEIMYPFDWHDAHWFSHGSGADECDVAQVLGIEYAARSRKVEKTDATVARTRLQRGCFFLQHMHNPKPKTETCADVG